MDLWDFMYYEDKIVLFGAFASLLCVFMILITWLLLPKWRTLQAYISANEIIAGTISYWSDIGVYVLIFGFHEYRTESALIIEAPLANYSEILVKMESSGLLFSFCWSLCASILAYIKLVCVPTPQISHEKKIATAFAIGVFVIVEFVNFALEYIFIHDNYIENDTAAWVITNFDDLAISVVSVINFALYIRICVSVLSCCSGISSRGWSHVIALIGVGFICHMTTAFFYTLVNLQRDFDVDVPVLLYTVAFTSFHLRLVTSTVVVLCNRPTRELWKKYWKKIKNRGQDIPFRRRQQN